MVFTFLMIWVKELGYYRIIGAIGPVSSCRMDLSALSCKFADVIFERV